MILPLPAFPSPTAFFCPYLRFAVAYGWNYNFPGCYVQTNIQCSTVPPSGNQTHCPDKGMWLSVPCSKYHFEIRIELRFTPIPNSYEYQPLCQSKKRSWRIICNWWTYYLLHLPNYFKLSNCLLSKVLPLWYVFNDFQGWRFCLHFHLLLSE